MSTTMKRLLSIFPMLFASFFCRAQSESELVEISDSLAMSSRSMADQVLSHFDTSRGVKLLYSLRNTDYYIVIREENKYKEYYVAVDSLGHIKEVRTLRSKKKDRKVLTKAFDLDKYHRELISRMPNATYVRGEPSYFVVKDESGKRYGEYSLSSLTLPNPIDGKVYGYLIRRLAEESAKHKKAAH